MADESHVSKGKKRPSLPSTSLIFPSVPSFSDLPTFRSSMDRVGSVLGGGGSSTTNRGHGAMTEGSSLFSSSHHLSNITPSILLTIYIPCN